MLQFSLSVGFVLMQVYLSVGFVLLQLSLSVYLIEIFPVCCSYHNGDHYNSVRRSGDLNSRTPPSIKLASLVVVPQQQQQQRVAAANSYRSNSSSGGGYCSSDSGAGISEDDSGEVWFPPMGTGGTLKDTGTVRIFLSPNNTNTSITAGRERTGRYVFEFRIN